MRQHHGHFHCDTQAWRYADYQLLAGLTAASLSCHLELEPKT